MNIDIQTLAVVFAIINFLQLIALLVNYLINRDSPGNGWWLLWSLATAAGFISMLLRNIPSIAMLSIFLTNTLLLAGQMFLYT